MTVLLHVQRDPMAETRTRRALAAMADVLNSLVNLGALVQTGAGSYTSVLLDTPENVAVIQAILAALHVITGTGTLHTVPRVIDATGPVYGDSGISDDGTAVAITARNLTASSAGTGPSTIFMTNAQFTLEGPGSAPPPTLTMNSTTFAVVGSGLTPPTLSVNSNVVATSDSTNTYIATFSTPGGPAASFTDTFASLVTICDGVNAIFFGGSLPVTFGVKTWAPPVTPVDGNMGYDGTHLYFQSGGSAIDLLAGGITGTGTVNTLPKCTNATGPVYGDSSVTDDGNTVTVTGGSDSHPPLAVAAHSGSATANLLELSTPGIGNVFTVNPLGQLAVTGNLNITNGQRIQFVSNPLSYPSVFTYIAGTAPGGFTFSCDGDSLYISGNSGGGNIAALDIRPYTGGSGIIPAIHIHPEFNAPGNGSGSSIWFNALDTTTYDVPQSEIQSSWVVGMHTAQTAKLVLGVHDFNTTQGSPRVGLTLQANGTVALVGVYSAPPVVQPSAISAPSGGVVVDTQARAAITSILNAIGQAAGGIGITA